MKGVLKHGKFEIYSLGLTCGNDKIMICPFCAVKDTPGFAIIDNQIAFAIFDKFPVNPGHTLIILKKHIENYFELTSDEQNACWKLVNQLKKLLDSKFHPDGYNIGINIFPAAGQTIPHVHIHVIPRYKGDVERPEGGVRGVIPDKKEYF